MVTLGTAIPDFQSTRGRVTSPGPGFCKATTTTECGGPGIPFVFRDQSVMILVSPIKCGPKRLAPEEAFSFANVLAADMNLDSRRNEKMVARRHA